MKLNTIMILASSIISMNATAGLIRHETKPAPEEDVYVAVEIGAFTKHFAGKRDDGNPWNEDNHLIGIEVGKGDWAVQMSHFTNSYDHASTTLGVGHKIFNIDQFTFGISFGLVSGYSYKRDEASFCFNDNICGYVAPSVQYDYEISEQITISPVVRVMGTAIVANAQLSYTFE
ncbi:hypothetical protein VPFG_00311 [Vibrio phage nt-1]|uniref:Outer membrane protein beta-barrel domain-containing protein n=1 Tax=Vibrio phage nt-1 TaxID=115992 RepID=R9TIU5_9CAUD|nr:antimicrobial peptide resistance and lipid A acylation protein PagP [Vibrio phage nt-1]AGN30310.2 hypothetical protein VPFG_00311 [Vibrio phage nt-1]